jgi:hypothetical protein
MGEESDRKPVRNDHDPEALRSYDEQTGDEETGSDE